MGGREGIHVPDQHHLTMRATGDAIPHPGGVTASPEMLAPLRHCGQGCSAWAGTGGVCSYPVVVPRPCVDRQLDVLGWCTSGTSLLTKRCCPQTPVSASAPDVPLKDLDDLNCQTPPATCTPLQPDQSCFP